MSWLKEAMGNTYRFTDDIIEIVYPTTYSGRVIDKAPFNILGCMENDDDIAFRMLDTGEVSCFMTDGDNSLKGVQVFQPYDGDMPKPKESLEPPKDDGSSSVRA